MTNDEKEKLEQELIEKQFNIITCVKCQGKFSFEQGNNKGVNLKDPINQQPLHIDLVNHYFENRFICLNGGCKQEQCKNCKAFPYHLGMTCEQFEARKLQKLCRYCDSVVGDPSGPVAFHDICTQDNECKDKTLMACDKVLACKHSCGGYRGEQQCLPCLQDECVLKRQGDQVKTDYCNICWSESLSQAPCMQSSCSHIFHYHCMTKRIEVEWLGPRINFNFCLCPLCKVWMNFQDGCPLQLKMIVFLAMNEDVKKKSIERLKYEGKDKDVRLSNPQDGYFNKPIEYALAIYCYYQCFKCKKAYFGGAKDCQRALENDNNKPFNPKELICGNCCNVEIGDVCGKHGKEYIEFKCKYCCNIALWFCWGTTHFCEDCHKRQCAGDYVSKYTRDKLPKCMGKGKGKCPIGGDHKPNGDEQSMGCALCRGSVQEF